MIVDFVGPACAKTSSSKQAASVWFCLIEGTCLPLQRQTGEQRPHSWVWLKVGTTSPSPGSGRQAPTSSALAHLQLLPPDLTYSLPRAKDRASSISCRLQGKIEDLGSLNFPGGEVDRNSTASAGALVWSLVQEGSICLRATKPMSLTYWTCAREPWNHNYWSLCA